jgi:hypothetical protein
MLLSAWGRSQYLALSGFYRRTKAKRDAQVANVACARKIALLFYNALKARSGRRDETVSGHLQRWKRIARVRHWIFRHELSQKTSSIVRALSKAWKRSACSRYGDTTR